MPAAKRVRTPMTDAWDALQLHLLWPEQQVYELIRPVVVFGLTPVARAAQTGAAARTIARQADLFEATGFAGLLGMQVAPQCLPEGMRDALLTLKGEYSAFNPHELATILAVRFGRRLSSHTVTRVLDTGPVPTAPRRRFLPYHQFPTACERRLAVIRLHLEGWSVKSIAGYLQTSRPTVYTTLQRWVAEDFAGLPDKSHTRCQDRFEIPSNPRNEIPYPALAGSPGSALG
ncbi:MAG: helix-turn-helix domain-containing protein [Dehalococcoidia bacterium]